VCDEETEPNILMYRLVLGIYNAHCVVKCRQQVLAACRASLCSQGMTHSRVWWWWCDASQPVLSSCKALLLQNL
jgi:hypothetical protein